METSTVEIEERGVKLRLTIVDTPGYGDGMDNKDRFVLHSFCKVLTTACTAVWLHWQGYCHDHQAPAG